REVAQLPFCKRGAQSRSVRICHPQIQCTYFDGRCPHRCDLQRDIIYARYCSQTKLQSLRRRSCSGVVPILGHFQLIRTWRDLANLISAFVVGKHETPLACGQVCNSHLGLGNRAGRVPHDSEECPTDALARRLTGNECGKDGGKNESKTKTL